tara:strand:- start:5421 stop:5981 length:561 start_codon:yes stop_codon:yes gene_type:complete
MSNNSSEAEIHLMGLILAQSALVGLGVGLFDAGMWLNSEDPTVNGFTYAMAAFFVQGIAYYFFKMFFEQNMQEKVRMTNMERERQNRFRGMQAQFDSRRSEMELRVQESQLENELHWMETNPGKMPPSWGMTGGTGNRPIHTDQNLLSTNPPKHAVKIDTPINLGLSDDTPSKKDGTPDKRFKQDE